MLTLMFKQDLLYLYLIRIPCGKTDNQKSSILMTNRYSKQDKKW